MNPRKARSKARSRARVMAFRERLKMTNTVLDKLRDNGGFTMNLREAGYATEGFAVSVNPERTRTVVGPVDTITLVTYVRDNWDLLGREGKVFGGWVDTETGITYLDVVTLFASKEEALDLAVQHGELAIFDLSNNQEIRTGLVKA